MTDLNQGTMLIDPDSPMMGEVNAGAATLLDACRRINIKLIASDETAGDLVVNDLAQGLQATFRQALERGADEQQLLQAIGIAVAVAAETNTLGTQTEWLQRLVNIAFAAGRMFQGARARGFLTKGSA